ncbi:unnamed protein product [Rotaria socialis]|uniref:NAD(P)(+)--arginine ADP-ribosyltransferase n=1 Tax=Rotaria socialis TaxID=392032 RepID=A0A821P2G9_9BILA|nr:unnamed protein product [Rotaria socialis]CAF4797607.1 unnamed protein product [Rotaria socialis]
MATPKGSGKTLTTARYADICDEPVTHLLAPIKGYQDVPLVSLEESLQPVSHFFNEIQENAWVAKENCQQPKQDLSQDEAAAIHLYTMQFDGGPSLFYVLNRTLRAENRKNLVPWFSFLKLFLTAVYKLPSCAQTVWRGVRDVDLSSKYPKGKKLAWWGVSSCTTNVEVLKNNQFLGNTGTRTIFSIECQNGKPIKLHSYYHNSEEEVILMPGIYLEVIGQLSPATGLHIIQLKEINPPFPLVKPPYNKSDAPNPAATATPLKAVSTSAVSTVPKSNAPTASMQQQPSSVSSSTKQLASDLCAPKVEAKATPHNTGDVQTKVKLGNMLSYFNSSFQNISKGGTRCYSY